MANIIPAEGRFEPWRRVVQLETANGERFAIGIPSISSGDDQWHTAEVLLLAMLVERLDRIAVSLAQPPTNSTSG